MRSLADADFAAREGTRAFADADSGANEGARALADADFATREGTHLLAHADFAARERTHFLAHADFAAREGTHLLADADFAAREGAHLLADARRRRESRLLQPRARAHVLVEVRPRSDGVSAFVAVAIAATLATVTVPLVASVVHYAEEIAAFGEGSWFGPAPLFASHPAIAWLLGGVVPAVVVAWLLARKSDSRLVRVGFGLWGLGQVALGGMILLAWSQARAFASVEFPTMELAWFGIAGVACVAVAAGVVVAPARGRMAPIAVLAVIATLGVHHRAVMRSLENEFQQRLPAFELRLIAAVPLRDDEVVPPGVEVVECGAHRCVLDPSDVLAMTHADIQRIRLEHDGDEPRVSFVLQRDAAERLSVRSKRRLMAYDAWFVNGALEAVTQYQDVLAGREIDVTTPECERLYARVTGEK